MNPGMSRYKSGFSKYRPGYTLAPGGSLVEEGNHEIHGRGRESN